MPYSKLAARTGTFFLLLAIGLNAYSQQVSVFNSTDMNGADSQKLDEKKAPAGTIQCASLDGVSCVSAPSLDAGRPLTGGQPQRRMDSEESADNQITSLNGQRAYAKEISADATQFQRFVTETTGRRLSLFGYTLFNGQPSTFAPIRNVPVPAEYVLGPGDEVTARVWGSIDSDIRATIDRNGQISIPKVGTFSLAGVKASELEAVLKGQIGRVFTNFSLSASLGSLRSIQVYVVGQARQPGVFTVSSLSTFVNALFASGGPAANGSMRNIQLKRDGKVVATLDLYAFITQGDKSQDMRLLPGDVIVIPPAGPRVAVFGALDGPGIYELQSNSESLKQVLAYAGGTIAMTSPHKVLLERVAPDQFKAPRFVEERMLDAQGLASTLQDGDLVTLFKISPKFSNAVTLRGNVASPLRYSYKPGMKLSDLLPEKEALLTPDYFLRKNALVEYEDRRDERDSQRSLNLGQASETVKHLVDEPNWEYAIIERMNSQDLKVQIIPFNLGEVVLKKNPTEDLALQPGDIVTIFSKKHIRTPISKKTSLVRIEGEVNAPGIYQIEAGETLQHLLGRVGGLTPQAYLFGAVFTREETRKDQVKNLEVAIRKLEQNLNGQMVTAISNASSGADTKSFAEILAAQSQARIAQLREMKPSGRVAMELAPNIRDLQELPELLLEDGDALIVPPRPGYVTAVGAVDNSNAIIWKPGRTVADTLRSAGVQADAEKQETFVLRADGSVVKSGDGWFSSSIDSLALMPGDTVVVPEKLDKRSFMTQLISGLKDWSQIISQFGLGAAAITVLK